MNPWKSRMFPTQIRASPFRICKCSVQIRSLLIAFFDTWCHILVYGNVIGFGICILQFLFCLFFSPPKRLLLYREYPVEYPLLLTHLCDGLKICSVSFTRLNKSSMLPFTLFGDCGKNRLSKLSCFQKKCCLINLAQKKNK